MNTTTGQLSRRRALTLLMTATGASVLAACGAPAPPAAKPAATGAAAATPNTASATPVTSTSGAPAEQPKPGGNLRVSAVGDVSSIDTQSWGPRTGFSIFMAYDTLTTYDLDLKPQPQLAESWEQSSDDKQLTLHLRKGVQFHSGRELTSEDVAFSLARPLDPKLQASIVSFTILQGFVPNGTTFEPTDKYTVHISSPVAWPSIFDYLQVLYIVDKDTAQGPITAATKVIGTGPFKFADWVQGQYLRFEKNPNYWQSGKPYLDSVQVNVKSDIQAMTAELEGGGTDLIVLPSWRDFSRLKSDPKYQAVVTPMPGYFYMFQPNVTFKPLDDKRVRQALNYAIDRKRIVENVILGEGTPMSTPWRSNSPAFEPAKQDAYAFDLDKAKSLMNQAGVSNLTLEMLVAAGRRRIRDDGPDLPERPGQDRHHVDDRSAGRRPAARQDAASDLRRHVRRQRHLGNDGAGVVLHVELDRRRKEEQRRLLQRPVHGAGQRDCQRARCRQTQSAVSGPERLPAG